VFFIVYPICVEHAGNDIPGSLFRAGMGHFFTEPIPMWRVSFPHPPNKGRTQMDWNRVEGNWKQFKGNVKEQWGKLTDDDLDQIAGKRDQLEGKIQERYGIEKDRVKRDVDDWYSQQP
jgi:uncharacterized protein YjbJ (UPF0337 family)